MVDKVNLVRKYSDRDHSALELLKAVSDRLSDENAADVGDITLSDWDYRRDKGIVVKGDAAKSSDVYGFKDRMESLAFGEGDDAERVFAAVRMGPISAGRNGRVRFTLELDFPEEGWQ